MPFSTEKKICIPVLLYHHINYLHKIGSGVMPGDFDWQMKYLKESGFETIFLDDLTAYKKRDKIPKKDKIVAVTFDDGYLDNWLYAFPVLVKYNIKATIFVITNKILECPKESSLGTYCFNSDEGEKRGTEDFLSWADIKQMYSSGLIDIQSHTHTHIYCDTASIDSIKDELSFSKNIIEKKLRKSCNFICWPWGRYNKLAISLAERCGYIGAVTSERGINTAYSDIMRIKRFNIWPRFGNGKLWFKSRLFIYTHIWLGKIYSFMVNNITLIILWLLRPLIKR